MNQLWKLRDTFSMVFQPVGNWSRGGHMLIMTADKRQELFASRKHTDTPQSTVAASAGLDLCDCWHSCDCRVEG